MRNSYAFLLTCMMAAEAFSNPEVRQAMREAPSGERGQVLANATQRLLEKRHYLLRQDGTSVPIYRDGK